MSQHLRILKDGGLVIRAVREAAIEALEALVAEPGLYLTRSRLVASVPVAHPRSRQLDADYERVIADALAAERDSDPATDLEARVLAKAAWSATQAAREVWLAHEGRRDPRALLDEAFDVLERGLR